MCHPNGPPTGADDARSGVTTSEVAIPVGSGETMPALLATLSGSGSRHAVLVVGDIFGARSPFYEHIAALLAAAGHDAIVPEFFFREGPLTERTPEAAFARRARLDDRRTLADLGAAVDWLRARPEFTGDRVGTLGFCLGGTLVLDLAARADLATVCYYGFPAGAPGPPRETDAPKPLDLVDEMHGPILAFWGDRDERVGMDNVDRFASALHERNIDFEHTVYQGLDHGFLAANFEPGSDGHDQAHDSWERALAFFASKL